MEIPIERSLRHWWIFLLRGLLFIATGIYMICSPASSYVALGFFFGLIIFLAGIAELMHSVRKHDTGNREWPLALGIIDILLGLVLMAHVAAGITILRIVVGIWFVFRGMSLFSFSRLTGRSWVLILGGLLTVLFGLLVIFNPVFGAMTIILWTAIAFIITGVFNVMLAFMLRKVYP